MGARFVLLALGLFLAASCTDPTVASGGAPPSAPSSPGAPSPPASPDAPEPSPAPKAPLERSLLVDVSQQRLQLTLPSGERKVWPISTAARGTGSASGSLKTPLGRHRISERFGAGAPLGTVFRARANTGEIAEIHTGEVDVEEDLVLTRILWLEGLEEGKNRGPGIDSKARYIYIHGTNEEGLIGRPASHGCVRMKNADVVELFELVKIGDPVLIRE